MQNICDSLKFLAERNEINYSDVQKIKDVMIKIYTLLSKNKDSKADQIKRGLLYKPIIFIPNSKLFVTCDRVVKSLGMEEIKPYLMEVPEEYGAYFKLFELLGMIPHPTICSFVRVLAHLKVDVGENPLHENELKKIQKALQQLCISLSSINETMFKELVDMNALYLPTRDKKLENATNIVYADNKSFEDRIKHDIGMPFMLNFEDIEVITVGNMVLDFKKLPPKLQPNILSEMITKELNKDVLNVTEDERGGQLRDFVMSQHFL